MTLKSGSAVIDSDTVILVSILLLLLLLLLLLNQTQIRYAKIGENQQMI